MVGISLVPAFGTTFAALASGLIVPLRIDAIYVRNYDVIDHVVEVELGINGTEFPIGTFLIPSHLVTVDAPPVDLIPLLASVAIGGIQLGNYYDIKIRNVVAPTTNPVNVVAVGGFL